MKNEKRQMKQHIVLFGITIYFMILFWHSYIPAVFVRAEENIIYTSKNTKAGEGNGTKENPYGEFADAVKAAKDGDTIIILSGGAYANDYNSKDEPLVIDKAITVQGEDVNISKNYLNMRCGGIVLSKDVVFQNMTFDFVGTVNVGVYANGHTLTLDNSNLYETNKTNVYAGGLYYQNKLWGTEGEKGEIIIKNISQSHKIGDIYAGSKGTVFSKDGSISIEGVFGTYGQIYGTNFDGSDTEKTVEIYLTDSNIRYITGGEKNESTLYFNSQYQRNMYLSKVQNLIIENGRMSPIELDENVNICLKENGILDLSTVAENETFSFTINHVQGENGTVWLKKDQKIVVAGTITGMTDIVITSGASAPSLAEANHVYAETLESSTGEGVFTFRNPYGTQDYLVWSMKETTEENGIKRQWLLEEGDRKALTEDMIEVVCEEFIYDGNPIQIEVTVTDGDTILTEGVDYWIEYLHENGKDGDFTSAGCIEFWIIGLGNYADEVYWNVYIEKADYTESIEPYTISHIYNESGEENRIPVFSLPSDRGDTLYFLGETIEDSYGILNGTPTIDFYTGELTYCLKGQSTFVEGRQAVIPILVDMENYNQVEVFCIISLKDEDTGGDTGGDTGEDTKEQEALMLTALEKEIEFGKTLALTVTGGSGNGNVTYRLVEGTTGKAHVEGNILIPEKAGIVQIIATKAESDGYYAVESEPLEITILKAKPHIKVSHTSVYSKGKMLQNITLRYSSDITGTLQWIDAFGNLLPENTEILANTFYRWEFQPNNGNEDNYNSVRGSFILWKESGSGITVQEISKGNKTTSFSNVVIRQLQEYYLQKDRYKEQQEKKWEPKIYWQ